jgi:hypothetical protein
LALLDRCENELRAAARAKTQARRLARANGMRYMTTLTVPVGGSRDRAAVARLLRSFIRTRAGARFFRHGWLAALEPHKAGGYHVHILHANFLPAQLVRTAWTRHLLSQGYTLPVGTSQVRTHEKDFGHSKRAAFYACKYVSKSFGLADGQRGVGQHRYFRSQALSDGAQVVELGSWEAAEEWLAGRTGLRLLHSEDAPFSTPVVWLWGVWDDG